MQRHQFDSNDPICENYSCLLPPHPHQALPFNSLNADLFFLKHEFSIKFGYFRLSLCHWSVILKSWRQSGKYDVMAGRNCAGEVGSETVLGTFRSTKRSKGS